MSQVAVAWAIVAATLAPSADAPIDPRSEYLSVDGRQLYYESCGSGPAIVLLHDGLLHSVLWDSIWPALCLDYHVVRYDRRGFGRSDPATAPFSPEDDLLRVIDATGIKRAILVGASSGSAVAIDFAVAHPERVEALVLIGPVVHGMRSSDAFLRRGDANNAPLASGNIDATAANWAQDPYEVYGPRPEARQKIHDILVASPHNLTGSGAPEIRPTPPTVMRLSTIQTPTLLIVGEHDIADVHAFSGALQAALPVVRREVWPDTGHLTPLEDPEGLTRRIKTFASVVERTTVTVATATLARYAGRYRVGNSPATVAVKQGRLILQLNGDADVPLFAVSGSEFLVRTTGTAVSFERQGTARATAMIITNAGANPVRCPRI